MSNLGGRVQIFDTRECATERIFYLEELSAAVYLACDRALTKTELLSCLSKDYQFDREWAEVEIVLEELKERKILIEISGRYFALAVEGEIPSLPTPQAFAGGYVSHNKDKYTASMIYKTKSKKEKPLKNLSTHQVSK